MNKITQLQDLLKLKNIALTIIQNPDTIGYLTNFYSNPHERIMLLILQPNEQPILILPALDYQMAQQSTKNITLISHFDNDNVWDIISHTLQHITTPHASVDKSSMTVAIFEQLQRALPNVAFTQDCTPLLTDLKVIKSDDELTKMIHAGKSADLAVQFVAKALKVGKSELEVITEIESELKKQGVKEMSFDTMVLRDVNAANPHGVPSDDKITWNSFVLVDLGTMYEGFASDITRTLFFGDTMSHRQKELYQLVLKAHHTARDGFYVGMRASELDKLARDVIENAGYGQYFTHRLGHGIGSSVHEFPSIASNSDVALVEGMCFSIEPGIYILNEIGIRIEDCFMVTKDGLKSFTNSTYSPYYQDYL